MTISKNTACKNCKAKTQNPAFCSKSCAASYNNKLYPKRKPQQRYCKHCQTEVFNRRTVCDDCNPAIVDWSTKRLSDMVGLRNYQRHSRIRGLARKAYIASGLPKECSQCGYDKHYEICHIRAIKDWPENTVITDINSIDNLLALCRNCHWEFDNSLLTVKPWKPRS